LALGILYPEDDGADVPLVEGLQEGFRLLVPLDSFQKITISVVAGTFMLALGCCSRCSS
jgi:hypothetical protein